MRSSAATRGGRGPAPWFEVVSCPDVPAFLDYLRPSRPQWHAVAGTRSPADPQWIYRGQADASWNLLPGAFGAVAVPRAARAARLRAQLRAEVAAVRDFIALADRLGISPLAEADLQADLQLVERRLDGVRSRRHDPEVPHRLLHDAMALAQHHGVPTRLLDWTTSSLVSAYFAARGAWDGAVRSDHIAVWALDIAALPPDGPLTAVLTSYSRNPFMRAQRGAFTHDREANRHFLAHGRWRPHDQAVAAGRGAAVRLRQVRLASAHARDLLRALYREDLSPAHLMPTLDHVRETCEYHRRLFG